MRHFVIFTFLVIFSVSTHAEQEMWNGLVVEPENRCSPYDKNKQYPYSQNLEDRIVEIMGGMVYGPYTGRYFDTDRETDIEHIVATSEGHDSGLCKASISRRIQFATDQLNLTLASPQVNRCSKLGKCGLDAAEWMPERNKCWFANRVVEVKTKYGLSVDQEEANALESVLSECDGIEMIFYQVQELNDISFKENIDALIIYDTNNNGRITCSEARAHGITPVSYKHPAYKYMNDSDGDGFVCE